MPTFSYIARTGDGTLEKGDITAQNPEQARERLRKKNLMVDELKELESDEKITFAGGMPWTSTDEPASRVNTPVTQNNAAPGTYLPLVDTLRLFAGWLLAWYALVYLLGSYNLSGKLPFEVPFLQGLFESPLVLRFSFGTFLFLALSSLHTWMGKGTGKGIALGVLWLVLVMLFHLNA